MPLKYALWSIGWTARLYLSGHMAAVRPQKDCISGYMAGRGTDTGAAQTCGSLTEKEEQMLLLKGS